MPTTKFKNLIYRVMLPFFSPSCSTNPIISLSGHPLTYSHSFESILRRHHVLGSAVLLTSEKDYTLICTCSDTPVHRANPDTFFRVASITKTATAILTMRLADKHILDLDCAIGRYFSNDISKSLDSITLRHLLSHTSGISDPVELELFLENGVSFIDLLNKARISEPGISFHYSNLGFGIIGCVMESVLQEPIGKIFQQHLFEPLNMNATLEGCLLPKGKIMPVTRILPYRKNHDLILTRLGTIPLLTPDPLHHYGHTAGSMYTDIVSLQRLFNVLISENNGFLSEKSRLMIQSEQACYGKVSPNLTYGYGLLRISDQSISDSLILGHQGFAYGCADGAFWEKNSGRMMIILNGGCSEARTGRLGLLNRDMLRWAFRKELLSW